MNFANEQYLWWLLAALIPWLLWLLRRFAGEKRSMPSLVFLYEYGKKSLRRVTRLWFLALQSLCLIALALSLALPFSWEKKQYFCVLDDTPRLRLETVPISQIKAKLSKNCANIWSLAALAENEVRQANSNIHNLNRYPEQILANWAEHAEYGEKSLLFITHKKNYRPALANYWKDVSYYAMGKDSPSNAYLYGLDVTPHPFDFRKRELSARTNRPNASVRIERDDETTIVRSDEKGHIRTVLNVSLKSSELVRLVVQDQNFTIDNAAYALVLPRPVYRPANTFSQASQTLSAALNLPTEQFPYAWVQEQKPAAEVAIQPLQIIRSTKTKLNSGEIVLPPRKTLRARGKLDAPAEVFQRNHVERIIGRFQSVDEEIVARFQDGTPAIVRQNGGLRFLFDPDSAPKALKEHPSYALKLLDWVLTLARAQNLKQIKAEYATVGGQEFAQTGFEPGFYRKKDETTSRVAEAGYLEQNAKGSVRNWNHAALHSSGQSIARGETLRRERGLEQSSVAAALFILLLTGSLVMMSPIDYKKSARPLLSRARRLLPF